MTRTMRLIVHADDFGHAEAINRGIAEAHDRGIVTSASVMATGEAFEHAVALARSRPTLDIGVHLVLTEHQPLSVEARSGGLTGGNGRLVPGVGALVRRLLCGRISLGAVRAELDAQIRRVQGAGLAVSHLDGHQHVHALPGVARVVTELAAVHGIAAVRYPVERIGLQMLYRVAGWPRLVEQLALNAMAMSSPLAARRRCDTFAGFYFGGKLNERNLVAVIAALPAGRTVELMCHPGHDDMLRTPRWQYEWSAECAALTSARVRDLVAARGIELISYRDI